ncbi:MAG: hypothetical protein AVDCRST_MAG64-3220, partial [uncultured Phycisphaerae bacterium]
MPVAVLVRRSCACCVVGLIALLAVPAESRGDKITLVDGTVIYGTAISQGTQY